MVRCWLREKVLHNENDDVIFYQTVEKMLTISPERVMDIHSLNEEFLQLVANAESGETFGIDDETFQEIKALSGDMIARIAATDLLLFTINADEDPAMQWEHAQGVPYLVERVHIVARDFAREDTGLAVSYLGVSKANCTNLLKMGTVQIRETSRSGTIRIIPLGTSAFRMLGKLASPAERTQYVALAAND